MEANIIVLMYITGQWVGGVTSQLTWEFGSIEHGTRITVVDHVTSLVGQGMIDGHRNGHDKALDQLLQWLSAHGEQARGDR